MAKCELSLPMKAVRDFLELIKFEHTIFALPFAYLGMLLAAGGWPGWHQFIWITVAMAAARTVAMGFNRIADRFLDARNPRTARRPLGNRRNIHPHCLGWHTAGRAGAGASPPGSLARSRSSCCPVRCSFCSAIPSPSASPGYRTSSWALPMPWRLPAPGLRCAARSSPRPTCPPGC